MTWLKLSDDFPKDCRRAHLSSDAFRVHVEMLCFCMDDENGGFVTDDDIIATSRAVNPLGCVKELTGAGFWVELTPQRWQILHQMNHQPDPETLAARRAADALRQNRRRRRAAGLDVPSQRSRPPSRRDTPRDDTRDPGRVGAGLVGVTQEPNPPRQEEERLYGWEACPSCGCLDPCDCEE